MNNQHKLAAYPTPTSVDFDFDFASEHEMKQYIQYESARTRPEISALGVALTAQERETAKEGLTKKRKAIYKMWKELGSEKFTGPKLYA